MADGLSARPSKVCIAGIALLALGACRSSHPVASTRDRPPSVVDANAPRVDAASPSASASAATDDAAATTAGPPRAVQPKLALVVPQPSADPDAFADAPEQWTVSSADLPAISEDGKSVAALGKDVGDGARDYPSVSLFVFSLATEKLERRLPLLRSQEHRYFEDLPLPEIIKRTRARTAAAQAVLDARAWIPMSVARDTPQKLPGVDVQFDGTRLRATHGSDVLVDRDVSSWRVRQYRGVNGPCVFKPWIRLTAIDPQQKALLVEVDQTTDGGDDCRAPPPPLRVYRTRR